MSNESYINLHPWGVIYGCLMELPSDDVCKIVDFTGLHVDWKLTKEQEYSNTTRKRAYRTKIHESYEKLHDDEMLKVAQNVATQLAQRDEDFANKMNDKLKMIGWKFELGRLTTNDVDLIEMFFPRGTEHDAYISIRKIMQKAKTGITIIDPYLDNIILKLIGTIEAASLQVKILSHKLPSDFCNEVQRFRNQHSKTVLDVRKTKEFHDRFIIVDETECYHIGASTKDAGNKAFMISAIEDPENVQTLNTQFYNSWNKATRYCWKKGSGNLKNSGNRSP